MALGVAAAFSEKRNLCVEAPTGVGKSFAYLVPAIYYALEQKLPVLISTETISLQEQLVEKDLPLLRKIMDVPFTVALAKGRGWYGCQKQSGKTTKRPPPMCQSCRFCGKNNRRWYTIY